MTCAVKAFREVDPKTPVNDREQSILQYWRDHGVAEKSITRREGHPQWVFYEGPPTANGRPGIHHVLARTLKDTVCRYKTMRGYQVNRKAGWDTHGLPVEIEVEKQLGLTSKPAIEEYGIEAFNKKCRESVFTYEREWRNLTERIAYWLDMDHPYITLDNNYIESVWWILKRFFDAGLIYEGYKVMPYCPRCGTPLASHEVAQGYKDETIDSIYVRMKVKGSENEYFLVWTTTPWTLPSNVALAVNPESIYVRARLENDVYYIVKERVQAVLGKDAEVLSEVKGKDLEYMEYEQLMPFVTPSKKAFFVTLADYVSTEDGTGIVHIAPAFGEDDYQVGKRYDLPVLQLVDEQGRFVKEVTPWAGMFVKQADPAITRSLKEEGKLFKRERITHSYPHCWRCDTPLLYYARKSWYIATTAYRDKLIANNNKIKWYPEHVGKGRFGDWLENLVDWSLSRNRYWGTPLNIWRCEKCGKLESVGSRVELAEKAVEHVDPATVELHRPYVDEIHLKCSCGGRMTRTPEVIDCWFDSGSMPYAQWHYPFEHKDDFHKLFPADFICEGIDQTRGWFYSLLAISTFLFNEPAFKSVLVNDLVLDKNGQKMSKSRGNTVEPWNMIDKFGVDALRWYLIAVSPPWVPTRFDEDGVKEVAVRFFGTLQNVYSFFTMYANIDGLNPADFCVPLRDRPEVDRWIISRLNSLVKSVTDNVEEYELTRAVRSIAGFVVDEVSNWYVRRNRERFWANELTLDKKAAYRTLWEVLVTVAKLMAPFAPFISEDIYLNLTGGKELESVHLADWPVTDEESIDRELENRMGLVIQIVELGRSARNQVQIKTRQPLSKILVNGKCRPVLSSMENLVKEELNVKEVEYVDNLSHYVDYEIKPNFPVLGPKYGKLLGAISAALKSLDPAAAARSLNEKGYLDLDVNGTSMRLISEEIEIRIHERPGFAVAAEGDTFVVLDTTITDELVLEGIAREIVSKVQNMRKAKGFNVVDSINLYICCDDQVRVSLEKHGTSIMEDTLAEEIKLVPSPEGLDVAFEKWDINGHDTYIGLENLGPRQK